MALGQINTAGLEKVQVAIERIKAFEPDDGYYLCFSGGKDSVVIKALADLAGVRYDAHYNVTTVDPPELVRFICKHHADVELVRPKKNMFKLIGEHCIPPTRTVRYCCKELKEAGGNGRMKMTGVRKAESARRRQGRHTLEVGRKRGNQIIGDPDNPSQEMIHRCHEASSAVLNPIIDWSDADVWEFIKGNRIDYCSLYDEGLKRLGCIGCPCSTLGARIEEFRRWPSYYRRYLLAFEAMLKTKAAKGHDTDWATSEDVMAWWLGCDKENLPKEDK
jgi:phosphoadenosine phosphosulfate reductase